MLKFALFLMLDAVLGLTAAAVLLAVAVPLLIRQHLIAPGDVAGTIVIAGVLGAAVVTMLVRPGGSFNRFRNKR